MLLPVQGRPMLESYVDSGDEVELLLLHGNIGPTDGLGYPLPIVPTSKHQRIRRLVPTRCWNDLQRGW